MYRLGKLQVGELSFAGGFESKHHLRNHWRVPPGSQQDPTSGKTNSGIGGRLPAQRICLWCVWLWLAREAIRMFVASGRRRWAAKWQWGGEGSSETKSPSSPTTRLSNFNKSVAMAHDPNPKDEDVRTAELAALVELGLGKALDEQTFAELTLIQADTRNEQLKLQQRLIRREISPDEYLQLFESAEVLGMMRSERLLGSETFSKIFGKTRLGPLIDKKTFLEEHRLR
jgi:hypothetical protein